MKKAIRKLDNHDTVLIYISVIMGNNWKDLIIKNDFVKSIVDNVKKGNQNDGIGYNLNDEQIAFLKKAINNIRITNYVRGLVVGTFGRGLHC